MIVERTQQFKLIFSVSQCNRFFIALPHALISVTLLVFMCELHAAVGERRKPTWNAKENRAKCIKGNNWCAHIAGSTTCYIQLIRQKFISRSPPMRAIFQSATRRRFSSNLITHCVVYILRYSSRACFKTWTTMEKREKKEKDQSLPSGGKRREMRKRLEPRVKDQRISSFNCCSRCLLSSSRFFCASIRNK